MFPCQLSATTFVNLWVRFLCRAHACTCYIRAGGQPSHRPEVRDVICKYCLCLVLFRHAICVMLSSRYHYTPASLLLLARTIGRNSNVWRSIHIIRPSSVLCFVHKQLIFFLIIPNGLMNKWIPSISQLYCFFPWNQHWIT